MNGKRQSGGFAHVELLTTITLLSTLAAVALPKWVDLDSEARRATLQSLAGSLTTASVMNGAVGQLRGAAEPVMHCEDASRLMVNLSPVEGNLVRWQDRELRLTEAADGAGTTHMRECMLSDTQFVAAGEVRFFIQTCSDRICRQS